MELDADFEDGKAYFQNKNDDDDDDSMIDPDVALSCIDDKIQDLLGHVQKDFEDGLSAENLGSMFGGYGSFLPTYQHSPKIPPKVLASNAPTSLNNPHIEGGHQNSTSYSSASVRQEPAFTSVASEPKPRGPPINDKTKQKPPTSAAHCSDKFTLNGQKPVNNCANSSDRRTLKVRIKVGYDNLSTKKNAELYSGLGLDGSPSSSLEASPVDSDGFFHAPDESPTSILETMTSFPVRGSLLLSPLPYHLMCLTEKEKWEDSRSQESTLTVINGSDSGQIDRTSSGEKSKSTEKESINGNDIRNGIGAVENGKGGAVKEVSEAKNMNAEGKSSDFATKADLNVSKAAQKATSRIKDTVKMANGKETSSSKGKRKSKGSQLSENGSGNSYGSKSYDNDSEKNNVMAKEIYKDFFGQLDLVQDDDMVLEEQPFGDSVVIEKGKVESNRKERLVGNKSQKPSFSDATVAPVVNEDWVRCDKCEKWRLLPPGQNPGSLPGNWFCSMLDWLPGMNRCSISQEETTAATTSRFLGPALVQSFKQPVHPSGPQSNQRHQHIGSQELSAGVKKKHGSKDLPNETKQDRSSLSSNSLKNLQTSFEVKFQDPGQSSSLVAEKHRRKHKEKKKPSENFMDEGKSLHQSKIKIKRNNSQDISKDSKKVDTDGEQVTDEDHASDHGLPAGDSKKHHLGLNGHLEDSNPVSKVSAKPPENQKNINSYDGTFHMGRCEERDVKKRRTPHEFEDTHLYLGKKARVSKSEEEATCLNVKSKQRKSLDVMETSKSGMVPTHASLGAPLSSSKVSISHKTRVNHQESKGSSVASVSSCPLKISNIVKFEKESAFRKQASVKPLIVSAKSGGLDGQSKYGHHGGADVGVDVKQNIPMERGCEKSSKRDVHGRGKSHSLPPSGRPIPGSPKENVGNTLSVDAVEGNNASRRPKKIKKSENQKGNQPKNMRHLIPNRHEGMDNDSSNPLRWDSSSHAANIALKEAKDLKHLADRVKNSGSNSESRALYLEAALKFLHGASLLESCYIDSGKHSDMVQSIIMYSSTAKLCEFCAHEYERSKEMSIAALAYKCAEVAYLKVVYSSHTGACKDRHELQTSLHLTGESPSLASDLDNLNNPLTVDKVSLPKDVAGNHIISALNKPSLVRILNFTQDVGFAMEASRKAQVAFSASSSKLEEAHHKDVKRALDFNFHDIDGLLHLVRLAIEVINK